MGRRSRRRTAERETKKAVRFKFFRLVFPPQTRRRSLVAILLFI
jgi:hypothetical protein